MPDKHALMTAMVIVVAFALSLPMALALWRRSSRGRRRVAALGRAKALRLLRNPEPSPLIKASLAQLRAATDRIAAARNTTIGMFSRRLRAADASLRRELEFREAAVSASVLALYGQFDEARDALTRVRMPASPVLPLLTLQPEFLLQLLDDQDFAAALVTAHQGRELANARSLDGDGAAPVLRFLWDTYLLIAEVLVERRAIDDLRARNADLNDAHLEVVARWAAVTVAARTENADAYECALEEYRAIAPHCAAPSPLPQTSPSTSAYR